MQAPCRAAGQGDALRLAAALTVRRLRPWTQGWCMHCRISLLASWCLCATSTARILCGRCGAAPAALPSAIWPSRENSGNLTSGFGGAGCSCRPLTGCPRCYAASKARREAVCKVLWPRLQQGTIQACGCASLLSYPVRLPRCQRVFRDLSRALQQASSWSLNTALISADHKMGLTVCT